MYLSNISGGGAYRRDMLNAQFSLLFMKRPQERQFLSAVSGMLLCERWPSHVTPRLESLPIAADPWTLGLLFAAPSEVVLLLNRQLHHPDTLQKAAFGDPGLTSFVQTDAMWSARLLGMTCSPHTE